MPRRLTLRGRRDVTGGWEETVGGLEPKCRRWVNFRMPLTETLACLSGICADAYRAPLLMMGITRRGRRGKAEMSSDDRGLAGARWRESCQRKPSRP
jgi:hypothetical protein